MMPQSNLGASLSEAEFNNLCSHYKDTYEIHLASIKQRDTLFYALLVILALFSLQVTSTDLVNSALSSYANKQLELSIDKNSNLFGTLLWLLLFGFSSRYYQTVIQIERQYDYIHHLEEIIGSRFTVTRASPERESHILMSINCSRIGYGCYTPLHFRLLFFCALLSESLANWKTMKS